jgi:hypothetical protein
MMAQEITKPPAPVDPVKQITAWIIAGHGEPDIAEAIAATWPNAKARPLIIDALKKLTEAGAEPDRDLVRGFAMEGTREIYRRAAEMGDLQTALRALKQLMELART